MSDQKLTQLKIKYTANASQIGELHTQRHIADLKIQALTQENISLMQQFALLTDVPKEESSGSPQSAS